METIFTIEEARVIKGIPLSPVQVPDRIRWRCTANGAFSVRSAYHLEMETIARKGGERSGKHSKKEFWKVCWQLHTPNMVKMFLWRALHNLLPTRRNLKCKGVTQNSVCPICEREEEDIAHVLWTCPLAVDVWGCGVTKFQKMCVDGLSFTEIFEDLVGRCPLESEIFAVTARRLCLRRNAVIHGEQFTPPNQLIREVSTVIVDF